MKTILLLIIFSLFLTNTQPIYGHGRGLPPFFKLNGVYTDYYPIISNAYLPDFEIPEDAASRPFLINEEMDFEIDTSQLPFTQEALKNITFEWDYGDGGTTSGTKNSYTYKKIGTFIMKITAKIVEPGVAVDEQMIQSTMIHIIPNENYQLPKAVITVNGQVVGVPPDDIIEVNFKDEVTLDGSGSQSNSSKVMTYFWDIDDGNSSNEKVVKHKYELPRYFATPILRIKDDNGFIVDTAIGLRSKEGSQESTSSAPTALIVGTISFLLIAGLGLLYFKKGKKV